MKPLKGKRTGPALRPFEIQPGLASGGRPSSGSVRTAAVRFGDSTVALLGGACQRRLSLGLKGFGKVGSLLSGWNCL